MAIVISLTKAQTQAIHDLIDSMDYDSLSPELAAIKAKVIKANEKLHNKAESESTLPADLPAAPVSTDQFEWDDSTNQPDQSAGAPDGPSNDVLHTRATANGLGLGSPEFASSPDATGHSSED